MAPPSVKYTWTIEDLAKVCGVSADAIYMAKMRGEFDPESFESLFPFVMRKGRKEIKLAMIEYGLLRERGEKPVNPLVASAGKKAEEGKKDDGGKKGAERKKRKSRPLFDE
jgi:hypothetical protein